MKRVVAITGARGAIGPTVAAAFAEAGFDVRALTRSDGDVLDREALSRSFAGAEIVVHLAAKLHVVDPPPAMLDEFRRINVDGTENVIRAAEREGVRRVVHASTIAVYGYSGRGWCTEASRVAPDTLYGKTKLESERIALSGDAVVLRFAAVYGSRVKGNYRKLLMSLNRGRFVPLGSGQNYRTLVYDRDVARAIVIAATHPAAAGEIFNVSDGSIHTVREVIDAMAQALRVQSPRLAIPVAPARVAAGMLEVSARLFGRRPAVSRSMISKYVEDVKVSAEKIRVVVGFEPAYTLSSGWGETVAMMRAAGEL